MNVDLFIRSYYKDLRWLAYCLRSIHKYARGFRKTILVVPEASMKRLTRSGLDSMAETHVCDDFADDYLGQQVTKMHADEYSDADFICHIDSDCMFCRDVTPRDLFARNKVLIPMTAHQALPTAIGWRRLSERFMCRRVEYDFMRRQPFLYPRWLYPAIREYAAYLHKVSLSKYILSQPPRGFSEYNAMGAFAYYFYFEKFEWQQLDQAEVDQSICRWFWSWGGISGDIQQEIDAILHGGTSAAKPAAVSADDYPIDPACPR